MIVEQAIAICDNCNKQENALKESDGRWKLPHEWISVAISVSLNGVRRDASDVAHWNVCSKQCERAVLHRYAEAFL